MINLKKRWIDVIRPWRRTFRQTNKAGGGGEEGMQIYPPLSSFIKTSHRVICARHDECNSSKLIILELLQNVSNSHYGQTGFFSYSWEPGQDLNRLGSITWVHMKRWHNGRWTMPLRGWSGFVSPYRWVFPTRYTERISVGFSIWIHSGTRYGYSDVPIVCQVYSGCNPIWISRTPNPKIFAIGQTPLGFMLSATRPAGCGAHGLRGLSHQSQIPRK